MDDDQNDMAGKGKVIGESRYPEVGMVIGRWLRMVGQARSVRSVCR